MSFPPRGVAWVSVLVLAGCDVVLLVSHTPAELLAPRALTVTRESVCALSATAELRCFARGPLVDAEVTRLACDAGSPICGAEQGVIQVVGGAGHWCAVRGDARVACSGDNDRGQLGVGTLEPSRGLSVADIPDVRAIGAGYRHTCAVTLGGQTFCWGEAQGGQLGLTEAATNPAPRTRPVSVTGAAAGTFQQVAGGEAHTCATTSEGAVWCWGQNVHGQVGDGTRATRFDPVRVEGLPAVSVVGLGREHSCAIDRDGGVWCWGSNGSAQVGDGTRIDRAAPVRVAGVSRAVALALGAERTCMLDREGALWCWGTDDAAGTQDVSLTPRQRAEAGRFGAVGAFEDALCVAPAGTPAVCCVRRAAELARCREILR